MKHTTTTTTTRACALAASRAALALAGPASAADNGFVELTTVDDGQTQQLLQGTDGPDLRLPFTGILLEVATPLFERRAQVTASSNRTYWAPVGGGLLYRGEHEENLQLSIADASKRFFKISVADGSNPPLDVKKAKVEYHPQELVFRADKPGAYTLFSGAEEAGAPSYDLPSILARAGEVTFHPATMGAWAANPAFGQVAPTAEPAPLMERYKWVASVFLVVVLAALGAWTFRLLRAAKTE